MAKDYIKLLQERVNLRICIVALVIAGIGILLLFVVTANNNFWVNHKTWQAVIQQIGGLLLVTVVITLLWEFIGKRAFLDEILAKANISKELGFAGITQITDSFHQKLDWSTYFRSVNKLDIFFAYGRTWRNTHLEELQKVVARRDTRIRVVLPDHEIDYVVQELARMFNSDPASLKASIVEAEEYFRALRNSALTNGAKVDIWFLPAAPHFSFYRFDRIAIMALYTHRKDRAPVPTFVCEKDGTLYDYIRQEFDAVVKPDGIGRHVTG